MDNNGFDYNALRRANPKFSTSQTPDPPATKAKPKTFSMTQGRPLIQNPKIGSTHNTSSFKVALFKKPEALVIPDASRRSVFSFQEDRDGGQGGERGEHCHHLFREYRSDDDYRRKERCVITIADLTQTRKPRIHPFSTAQIAAEPSFIYRFKQGKSHREKGCKARVQRSP